jgi:predicted RNase H-like HicB family nuclease
MLVDTTSVLRAAQAPNSTKRRGAAMWHAKYWNGKDGYLVAQCEELPAAIAQGKTKKEIQENMNEAIKLVLNDMLDEIKEKQQELGRHRVTLVEC